MEQGSSRNSDPEVPYKEFSVNSIWELILANPTIVKVDMNKGYHIPLTDSAYILIDSKGKPPHTQPHRVHLVHHGTHVVSESGMGIYFPAAGQALSYPELVNTYCKPWKLEPQMGVWTIRRPDQPPRVFRAGGLISEAFTVAEASHIITAWNDYVWQYITRILEQSPCLCYLCSSFPHKHVVHHMARMETTNEINSMWMPLLGTNNADRAQSFRWMLGKLIIEPFLGIGSFYIPPAYYPVVSSSPWYKPYKWDQTY